MFNAWYTNNETYVGPLSRNNELTLDVKAFLSYAQHIKSSASGNRKSSRSLIENNNRTTDSSTTPSTDETDTIKTRQQCTKYSLNEFMVGPTRMQYYDGTHYLGFAAHPYTSSLAIQNIERLVIHPDIGYYTRNDMDDNFVPSGNQSKKLESRKKGGNRLQTPTVDENEQTYVHSDYTRKYSPQEALARVLASPLFNGNNTKTILQSSKSERYYQLTFPLENCGRMYVLAAPMIPCYSVMQPWAHICRLFQINLLVPPSRYVVPIDECPQWSFLRDAYDVKYVILLPPNLSLMNRRDPVIQEGSIEIVTTIFAYDNCDADIQFNNPYGCYNKHEDYDGDTNTQSVGKGVESHVEICYNMRRQCLPCLRVKSVVPQNMLSRIMMYFMQHVSFTSSQANERLSSIVGSPSAVLALRRNQILYDRCIRNQFSVDWNDDTLSNGAGNNGAGNNGTREGHGFDANRNQHRHNRVSMIFGLELFRRTCICVSHLTDDSNVIDLDVSLADIATRIFGNRTYGAIYLYYLRKRWAKILPKIRRFVHDYLTKKDRTTTTNDEESTYNATRNVLHDIHTLWGPVSLSIVTNCQTLIDDVIRTIYCTIGESECTRTLDHCSRTVHTDFPNFFLSGQPFDREYIVNILSRAKGDFDSLLKMHVSLYERFRQEAVERTIEATRSKPLSLGHRDLLTRIEPSRLEKYVEYTDKYVLGSKKIPKSCKQANSMKWAMQNVQHYDGDLWMNGELILADVTRYFSLVFFSDKNAINLTLTGIRKRRQRAVTIKPPTDGTCG